MGYIDGWNTSISYIVFWIEITARLCAAATTAARPPSCRQAGRPRVEGQFNITFNLLFDY